MPIYVSGLGTKAISLAARLGDGFISVKPDASSVRKFRESGGDGKPTQSGFKVCYAPTVEQSVRTAHRIWGNEQIPGELAQVLPSPRHFEQASTLVTPDMVAERVPCGPDPSRYVEHVRKFIDAGYDEVYVSQIGPDQEAFFEFWANLVAPHLAPARI